MKNLVSLSLFTSLFLLGCTQQPQSQDPRAVNPTAVKTILMVQDSSHSALCENEVSASGGALLYRNENGLIMTDLEKAALNLSQCQASVVANRTETLAVPKEDENSFDLPTLLRLLPAEEIGARSFIKENPTFDGRGVTIAVLDTGLELDHPMLSITPDGERKIIDFQDFSGQGLLSLEDVEVDELSIFKAPDGSEYFVENVDGTNYRFAVFQGSALATGDTFQDVGVITYEKDGKLLGRVDTNNDHKFGDEEELSNYKDSLKFIKLGAAKTLSVALNVLNDGEQVTLAFDDGSHGTHVAGIAAGYTPNGGLTGVAPGAKVIGVKIGDNRLSGGSTTTASKMLAIDYAVKAGADIINISYGIRAGSSEGQSAIDRYVDKMALEGDVLFAISAGNSGPGLQTIGTPAGANLAISPGAYVSKETAHENYGWLAVEQDNMWWFSSTGPRADGGFKPSIAAPGSALSSLPLWDGGHETYRGTSMAAPQVAGGLALILSAAQQTELPTDRVSVTSAVYTSAKNIPHLKLIEQGHGLMNVPSAVEQLGQLKENRVIEYDINVNTPSTPSGRGKGIYIRSRVLPDNNYNVAVTPTFPSDMTEEEKTLYLRTFKLVSSHDFIKTPGSFWIHGKRPRSFQVSLAADKLASAGLYSGKVTAIDETTNQVAFVIPVTVVSPIRMNDANKHTNVTRATAKVGSVLRYFIDVPAGTTAIQLRLQSDGPRIWGQLLDPEGRTVTELIDPDRNSPQPELFTQANITRPGVYELDLVAPAYNRRTANIAFDVKLFSLTSQVVAPFSGTEVEVLVQNNFNAVKVTPVARIDALTKKSRITITGDKISLPFAWTEADAEKFSALSLTFNTAKKYYDMMTDYPYMVYCEDGSLFTSGGLDLNYTSVLTDVCVGELRFDLEGAFTSEAPATWHVSLTEARLLKEPITLHQGNRTLIETGQQVGVVVDFAELEEEVDGYAQCANLDLQDTEGQLVQKIEVCP